MRGFQLLPRHSEIAFRVYSLVENSDSKRNVKPKPESKCAFESNTVLIEQKAITLKSLCLAHSFHNEGKVKIPGKSLKDIKLKDTKFSLYTIY